MLERRFYWEEFSSNRSVWFSIFETGALPWAERIVSLRESNLK